MKLDLRPRCERKKCNKLIRGKQAKMNYEHYKPFCSYHCDQWNSLEEAQRYLQARKP